MKWSLETLAREYKKTEEASGVESPSLGLGYTALRAFYSAVGVQEPISADLSANLINACQRHITANIHPSYASLALLDTKKFLLFIFKQGATRVDYSSLIKVDNRAIATNDFAAYEQHPRWKS